MIETNAALVEQVARAIYDAATPDNSRWECVEPHYQETIWRSGARAAIAALQASTSPPAEPTCAECERQKSHREKRAAWLREFEGGE